MSGQPDGNAVITVEVRANHIYGANPDSAIDSAMARALRDAGFMVMVELYTMVLDGREYGVDARLVQWQQDAVNVDDEGKGEVMIPIAMQLDFERRSVRFLKTLPWTT